jgi:septum site-determining protein MinC
MRDERCRDREVLVELKGDRRGLRCLAHGYTEEATLIHDLTTLLDRQTPFLGASRILVEVDTLPLTPSLVAEVARVFMEHPPLVLSGINQPGQDRPLQSTPAGPPAGALVVRTALRSGQAVEHPSDVVILGDVKPGARVIAGGDIFVLGRLAGVAMAGQPHRTEARVYALRFEPTQVRIATVLAVPASEAGTGPEFAAVEDGQIVVMPWNEAPTSRAPASRRAAY